MTDETTQEPAPQAPEPVPVPVPVDVKSQTVLDAEAADRAADAQTVVNLTSDLAQMGSQSTGIHHETLFTRMQLWTKTFEQSFVHGVETAITNADKAVKAFENYFHKS
jgi:hypothetical protein